LLLAKLVRIFAVNATFFMHSFGRNKRSFWTFDSDLALNKGQLRFHNAQSAPSCPLRMGMPITSGSLPVFHVADDIVSKHWDLPSVWSTMKPLLFWNWKLMAPDAAGKERSNIKTKDVADLVLKLEAKHNVKVTAQGKGQKSDHVLIDGSDKGTISPVIQSGNQGRNPSSRPRTTVHLKEEDTGFKRNNQKE